MAAEEGAPCQAVPLEAGSEGRVSWRVLPCASRCDGAQHSAGVQSLLAEGIHTLK